MTQRWRIWTAVLGLLALVGTACTGEAQVTQLAVETPTAVAVANEPEAAEPTTLPTSAAVVEQPTPTPVPLPGPSTAAALSGVAQPERTRLCLTGIEAGEVLNVRLEPSLDAEIVARVPPVSCSLTTDVGADLSAGWVTVRYETGHVRHDGHVSTDFVRLAGSADSEAIALQWMQAILDDRDRSPFEYPDDEFNTSAIEVLRGGVAVPYIDLRGAACTLEGDVTVECRVQVVDDLHRPVFDALVFVRVPGANGAPANFFPEDFGEHPLAIGGDFSGNLHFDVVAVDSDASLVGVPIGTSAEEAIELLIAKLGPPTEDTGWIVGCPLDSETDENERYIEWGSLVAGFGDGWGGEPESFFYWSYDFTGAGDAGFESRMRLPIGLGVGANLDDVSIATRLPIEAHELSGESVINGPGYRIFGNEVGAVALAAVPFLPFCD